MLETINYVEHYGLRRKEIGKGLYEPVDIHHSWNAP
jgi:alkane 1-monooxygenase